MRFWLLGFARFFTLCGFVLWLGGLAFFGAMAAPVLFRVSRAYGIERAAPEMVTLMLTRFGYVMLACGVMMLIGWGIERSGSTTPRPLINRLWWVQGIGILIMLALAFYLNFSVMPQIIAMQPQVLAATVAPPVQAAFDTLHDRYSQMAMIIVWTGLASLLAFALRTASESAEYSQTTQLTTDN